MPEPYRLILVDDEDEARGRISSKISAESGFVVAGTAGNGYDALELVDRLSPHAVLTDIKMPYIDGIEFAGILRRDYPSVRVAFITGYDEFDYAREAVELGVRSYLTKPLTQEDIAAFLSRLKAELDEEIRENYDRERLLSRLEESAPLLVENCIASMLASGSPPGPGDAERLAAYGVTLDDAPFVAVYAIVERNPDSWDVLEHEKLKLSVRSRLSAMLEHEGLDRYAISFGEGYAFIVKESGRAFDRTLEAVLTRMARSAEQFLSVRMALGVSAPHRRLAELAKACEEAEAALSRDRFGRLGPVSRYGQSGERELQRLRLDDGESKALARLLRFGSDDDVAAFLEGLRLKAQPEHGSAAASLLALGLATAIGDYASSLGLDPDELAGGDLLGSLSRLRSLEELFAWASASISSIRSRGAAARSGNARRLLERAAAEVQRRFADPDLTIDGLCAELAVSPSYLSQLFRRHMDTSFVQYLTATRIERAMELLATSGDRIVDIATACGYRDVYYFSHSFKRRAGVSPKKYRDERR